MTIKNAGNSKDDDAFIKRAVEIAKATLDGKAINHCKNDDDPEMKRVRDIAQKAINENRVPFHM